MQSTKSWVVRYFQKHETVKFSLLLRFVRDMVSFNRQYHNVYVQLHTLRLSLNCYCRSKSNRCYKHYN